MQAQSVCWSSELVSIKVTLAGPGITWEEGLWACLGGIVLLTEVGGPAATCGWDHSLGRDRGLYKGRGGTEQ